MNDLFNGLPESDAALLEAGAAELDQVLASAANIATPVIAPVGVATNEQAAAVVNGETVEIIVPAEAMLPPPAPPAELAKQLRGQTAAVRLQRGKWGVGRKLDAGVVQQIADQFGADRKLLGARKRLIDTRDKKYRAPCQTIAEAVSYWKLVTIPYPERGIRLIRKDRMAAFNARMEQFRQELHGDAAELELDYKRLVDEARESLGQLFREEDYPVSVADLFRVEWDYPNVSPASYLKEIAPALYEQEEQRIQARFEEAIRLTEQNFTERFAEMVAGLADRLEMGEDGKPLTFSKSRIDGLKDFFEQFRALNTGSSPQLDLLVAQAQELVGGVDPKELRTDVVKRKSMKDAMNALSAKLDTLMVAKPVRQFAFEDADGEAAE